MTLIVLAACLGWVVYTYVVYPLVLTMAAAGRRELVQDDDQAEWPRISISMPAYNEAATIRQTLGALLALDYPADRRQIVVVSDASSDGTDDIVREYSARGVELVTMRSRSGKTAAENAAARVLTGEIVINTDATISIAPDAVKKLVRQFTDPTVGVASGRDVSVAAGEATANVGESGYVGYDMTIRSLETRVGTIVGASGCFYAIRLPLHRAHLPESLSRDFASALIAREHGYRSVSVDDAICYVPRTGSIQQEYRRKVRTMTRGIATLWHKRHLLNPMRHPLFSWMLFSHKVCRWLAPWPGLIAFGVLSAMSLHHAWAAVASTVGLVGIVIGVWGWLSPAARRIRVVSLCAYFLAGNVAAMHALIRALRGASNPVWEPTRREAVLGATSTT